MDCSVVTQFYKKRSSFFYLFIYTRYFTLSKRLGRYCKIKLQFIKNEDNLLKKFSAKTYKIAISTSGVLFSSEELTSKIDFLGISGSSDITFIIGSKNTVTEETLAISKMEMSTGLKTTIIIEQIYRAYRILNNQPYHK